MFCNYGFQVFEDILDGARACSVAALQRSAAVGTALEAVFLATVNPIGFGPASAFVARLLCSSRCEPLKCYEWFRTARDGRGQEPPRQCRGRRSGQCRPTYPM